MASGRWDQLPPRRLVTGSARRCSATHGPRRQQKPRWLRRAPTAAPTCEQLAIRHRQHTQPERPCRHSQSDPSRRELSPARRTGGERDRRGEDEGREDDVKPEVSRAVTAAGISAPPGPELAGSRRGTNPADLDPAQPDSRLEPRPGVGSSPNIQQASSAVRHFEPGTDNEPRVRFQGLRPRGHPRARQPHAVPRPWQLAAARWCEGWGLRRDTRRQRVRTFVRRPGVPSLARGWAPLGRDGPPWLPGVALPTRAPLGSPQRVLLGCHTPEAIGRFGRRQCANWNGGGVRLVQTRRDQATLQVTPSRCMSQWLRSVGPRAAEPLHRRGRRRLRGARCFGEGLATGAAGRESGRRHGSPRHWAGRPPFDSLVVANGS